MPTLLSRLCAAVFAVPLMISRPILRLFEARKGRLASQFENGAREPASETGSNLSSHSR